MRALASGELVRNWTDPDLLHKTKQMLSLTSLRILERFLNEILRESRSSCTDGRITEWHVPWSAKVVVDR